MIALPLLAAATKLLRVSGGCSNASSNSSSTCFQSWGSIVPSCLVNTLFTALPPDVRRGFARPVAEKESLGYAHCSAFGPRPFGQSPNQGRSPLLRQTLRRGGALASHQAAEPFQQASDRKSAG